MESFTISQKPPNFPSKYTISLKFLCQTLGIITFFLGFSPFFFQNKASPANHQTENPFPKEFFQSEQVVLILGKPGQTVGKLYLFEMVLGQWESKIESIPVWFGRSGLIPSNLKREGDGFTPLGYFPIKRILGKEKRSIRTLEYTQISKNHYWNDNSNSKHYNQLVQKKEKGAHPLWNSDIYELFLVIEHNTNPSIPGMGSMIFLHPWKESNPTSGCVGIDKNSLVQITNLLDGNKNPFLIISEEDDL
ncbi:L,D-transpeptidase catalytic domain protein [Leptospira yanagawae serovar Saopaulo str. Sao Paulo = ATCC 700523]|uniref:L,D-transpeptidase catalytic domain protein n=1 Tax=Leptospira yanagawae serovar Saopaulo str. Sao Paulo = ATCC 700523 TaxID=1249483 RepID=A0A5E8HHL7_9LEPT|nr:L,D-transpeptidase family protein [Leptospira yanagawae]EOQ90422.1 L,D-transpeptidase catalytic domain protein [Leptospira yanagawae serovar Saopaulo str. Sao Paulo = ATCC 700523]